MPELLSEKSTFSETEQDNPTPFAQPARAADGGLSVSEELCGEVLSLPVFPELDRDRVLEVAAAIREFYGARTRA